MCGLYTCFAIQGVRTDSGLIGSSVSFRMHGFDKTRCASRILPGTQRNEAGYPPTIPSLCASFAEGVTIPGDL